MSKNMHIQHYVNGEWIQPDNNEATHEEEVISINPANGHSLGAFYCASDKMVTKAIDSAKEAFGPWALMDHEERLNFLKIILCSSSGFMFAVGKDNFLPLPSPATTFPLNE